MPPIHSNVVSADHKAPMMCFRDEGRGGVEVKHARLWEHSNISLSLLRDKTFKGESVRAYKKSQLINLLVTVPKTQTQTNQANVL